MSAGIVDILILSINNELSKNSDTLFSRPYRESKELSLVNIKIINNWTKMKTTYHLFLVVALSILTGCASQQVVGTGRYLQFSTPAGEMFAQTDYQNFPQCQKEAISTQQSSGQNVLVMCNTVSNEKNLPFSFAVTNIVTNESIFIRTKTYGACRVLLSEAQKKELPSALQIGECE